MFSMVSPKEDLTKNDWHFVYLKFPITNLSQIADSIANPFVEIELVSGEHAQRFGLEGGEHTIRRHVTNAIQLIA